MIKPHPLTDEICRQIAPFSELWSPTAECHDMRSAADWQLDRDAEHFAEYLVKRFGYGPLVAEQSAEDFKKAMRPQEDET